MDSPAPISSLQQDLKTPAWSLSRRVAFRFCFVYFGLYCAATQILVSIFPVPKVDTPDLDTLWPMRQIIFWTAAHVFRIRHELVYKDSGSGDKVFDWVMVICVLVFAAVATVIWSILDRRRENYVTLYKWFRLFIRFALASQMIAYGMSKVIPVQMPFPYLSLLIRPFGTFLPMAVLWLSIGSSPAYEIFAGCAEMLGGILLIFPRATMLGALICLVDMIQVFTLNMTYDVPVKLLSFHLVLMALFLLAPELSRLADFFLSNRAVGPSTQPQLFGSLRANRIAFAVQVMLGVWLVGVNSYGSWSAWHTYGDGRPRSALYGLWNVDQCSIDGVLRSPLLTDYDRWRRAIFEVPDSMYFERMDGSLARYGASINDNDKTLALTKDSDKGWKASFHFQRLAQDQLILDGSMDGHTMHMQLRLVDLKQKFSLVKRRFHWIQEYPYTP